MNKPLWSEDAGPIKYVGSDMSVIDVAGVEIGRVDYVKLGDPQAVTTEGQVNQSDGLVVGLVRLFGGGEPDTPRQLTDHLLRVGFVKVDGKGLLDRDTYVAADQIAAVNDDSVQLLVGWDDLAAER